MTGDYAIRLRDRRREVTLVLPAESCVSIIAAAQDDTEFIEELLGAASYYDETVTRDLMAEGWEPGTDDTSREAAFVVDFVDNRVAFPGNLIDFARRGVLSHRTGDGTLKKDDYRTYAIGRRFTLYDSDRKMPIDEKASLRNEKSLWSNALPPRLEDAGIYRLDGVDLNDENLREIYLWAQTAMPRAPEVNGKSVYEIHRGGYRFVTQDRGSTGEPAPTGAPGSGPGGPGEPGERGP